MAMLADSDFAPRTRYTGIVASLYGLLGSVAAAQEAARTYATLDALSDRELAARGLVRSDIPAIAARALNGR